jgi:cytochrome c oxidase subunit 2
MKTRFLLTTFVAALLLLVLGTPHPIAAEPAPRHIDILAKRFSYEPGEVTLKKGQPVVISLKSTDVAHGIHFKELNLQAKIDKGGTGSLSFTPMQTGDFVGHCSVFCGSGHGGMTLTFHVVE